MKRAGLWLGRVLLVVAVAVGAVVAFAPREGVGPVTFDPAAIGDDPTAWLAAHEADVPDLVPGTERRVLWADAPGARTPLAVVYIHGFSATSEEIRPVPDRVAEAFGANLHFARLTGHGRDAAAMAEATPEDWMRDTAEALHIGARIGERVVVIATSTGGTLATLAAADPDLSDLIDGLILVSPNYRLTSTLAQAMLDLPFVRHWGPWLLGPERGFTPRSDAHARFWTERYPTVSVLPMGALMRAARRMDHGRIAAPALILHTEDDRVVSPAATRMVADAWGGPVTLRAQSLAPGDDPMAHVVAGDILSPSRTDKVAREMIDWLGATLPVPR